MMSALSESTRAAEVENTDRWVLGFEILGRGDLARVGGKGANLGEMTQAGMPVPPGFCISTSAYDAFLQGANPALLDALDALAPKDLDGVRALGAELRAHLESLPIPPQLAPSLREAYAALGEDVPVAVRSSATAEDLPDASFAGQQDTYLNVIGLAPLRDAIRRCWASLFTDRAILYRLEKGFPHREVSLSVVVQRMVRPEVSGLIFTADPLTGHRGHIVIEASYGLGEALVSGLVTPDRFRVDSASLALLESKINAKGQRIDALPGGGTRTSAVDEAERNRACISDSQVRALAELGLKVAAHYGTPQDLEWGIEGGHLYLLQARPITSLFPIPCAIPGAIHPRVYASFHHFQVMLDPMPKLARSLWIHIFPFLQPKDVTSDYMKTTTALREGGERLWVDVTPLFAHPVIGEKVGSGLAIASPAASQRFLLLRERPSFQGLDKAGASVSMWEVASFIGPVIGRAFLNALRGRRLAAGALKDAIDSKLAKVGAAAEAMEPGAPRLRYLLKTTKLEVLPWLMEVFPPIMFPVILGSKVFESLLPDTPEVKALQGSLGRGLDGNVTTEMDLAVGDVADLVHGNEALQEGIRAVTEGARELEDMKDVPGGEAFLRGLERFLEAYGFRGPSEIDVSRARWSDNPMSLLQVILGTGDDPPGAHRARKAQHDLEVEGARARLIELVKAESGAFKGWIVRRLLPIWRHGLTIREHPKYLLIRTLALFRRAFINDGARLAAAGALEEPGDIFHLSLEELLALEEGQGALDDGEGLKAVAKSRRLAYPRAFDLNPPPLITSEGECPTLPPPKNLPPGAMAGTAASGGVVEGIARVLRDPNTEVLEAGEILVAPFTDPGWTPLFLNAKALVMEVGGMMTHGSVVAREYGIPAVVGVEGVCLALKTGDRVRVDGDRGLIFKLSEGEGS